MKLFHRLPTRTAFVLVLAAVGLLAATASASTGQIRVEGYKGHLGTDLRTNSSSEGLSFDGDHDYKSFDLHNSGHSTIEVHLHVRQGESGRFLLADEVYPHYTRCSTLAAGKQCQVIVLFESTGSAGARGTLEILDGTQPAYKIPLVDRK